MALGIEREKLGDLRVIDNSAIVPVYDEVANYILYELKNVDKAPVSIEEITEDNLPISNFLEGVIIVPSLRLDNIVSKLANISRGKAVDIIDSGKVLIDYSKSIDKSKEVKDGQRVTISGVGKFIIREIVGNTKSGRYKVKMNKFI